MNCVDRNKGNKDINVQDKNLLFPYLPYDTISFALNGLDTFNFYGGSIAGKYDKGYTNADQMYNECPDHIYTQNITQTFNSQNGLNIIFNTKAWDYGKYWIYTITFGQTEFSTSEYLNKLPSPDTLYFNGNKFSPIHYITANDRSNSPLIDSIYYCDKIGIFRVKKTEGIYLRIAKN